jgi:hypothetical protein
MAAGAAEPQMHTLAPGLQALLATERARLDIVDLEKMGAGMRHAAFLRGTG